MTSPSSTSSADLLRRVGILLGWISLFATIALMSPGIVATANAEEAASAAGPACQVSADADDQTAHELSQMIERLRAATAEQPDSASDVVSLNTRGWNYTTTLAAPPAERR